MAIKDFLRKEKKREERKNSFLGKFLNSFALALAFVVFVGTLFFERNDREEVDCEDN